ncbi:MAG: polysaccharide lyase [Mycobacterium sp.]
MARRTHRARRGVLVVVFATIVVVTAPMTRIEESSVMVASVPDGAAVRAPFAAQPAPSVDVLWRDRFDAATAGPLTPHGADSLFAPTIGDRNIFAHAAITPNPSGGNLLRHSIPAGDLGNFFVASKLTREVEHAVLEYDIRFDDAFDWRWGGKIPGLVGLAPGASVYAPTSGKLDRNAGFSTRLMWHGIGDDGIRPFQDSLGPIPPGKDNVLVTYAYVRQPVDGFGGYGWQTNLDTALQRGVWHNVKMEVELNTVGRADGVYRVWIDDALGFSASNWDYRSRPDVRIQAVLYDIHRGGNTSPGWLSSRESHIDVQNMTVTAIA